MSKNTIYFIPIIFLFFGLGFALGDRRSKNTNDVTSATPADLVREIRLREGYKFINPLLECDSNIGEYLPARKLDAQVQTYIQQRVQQNKISHAAVYFRDLNNGPWFGINEEDLFSPASLLKVPMMMAYYKLAEDNPKLLENKIINTGIDTVSAYKNVEYTLDKRLEEGKEYTIEELIDQMIINSDNVAYFLLDKNIDLVSKSKIYDDLGVDISKAQDDPAGNIVTIRNYASFLRILYNASYLSKELSEKAMSVLSQSKFSKGIVAGVPNGVTIAHKFGERTYMDTGEKQLHDCGVVYSENRPYLLCVMTRGSSSVELEKTISNISSIVYAFVSSQ